MSMKSCPLGQMIDFIYRIESQRRGKLHIHMGSYHRDAIQLSTIELKEVFDGKNVKKEMELYEYIDKHICCTLPPHESDLYQLVQLQKHAHRKASCFKRHRMNCRFFFPRPPMPFTMLLKCHHLKGQEGLSEEEKDELRISRQNWKTIHDVLERTKDYDKKIISQQTNVYNEYNINKPPKYCTIFLEQVQGK